MALSDMAALNAKATGKTYTVSDNEVYVLQDFCWNNSNALRYPRGISASSEVMRSH